MIDMLENPPNEYKDVIKEHFRIKKNEIIETTLLWEKENENLKEIRNKLLQLLL